MAAQKSLSKCQELAHAACREAVEAGADAAECAIAQSRSVEAELEEGHLKGASRHNGFSLSVKAFWRGGRGSYVIREISMTAARKAARRAASLACSATNDPDWKRLPPARTIREVSGLYDRKIADPDPQMAVEIAEELLAKAHQASPDCIVSGSVSISSGRGAFANSRGVAITRRSTHISAGCLAVIHRAGQHGSFYDFDMGRNLQDIEVGPVGLAAAKGAELYLGGRSIAGGVMPVVFGPLAAAALLESVVSAASAESLQRQRSFLAGRLGKRIASRKLTILDNGLVPGGIYSSPCDAEGVPRKPLLIIENGMLLSLLHNTYTAAKAKTRSTGHCAGAGCAPTNLQPTLGRLSSQEIIGQVKKGLYINSASVGPNPTSGEVSAMVDFGMAIENGRLSHPVANVSIGGQVLDMLKNIDAISSDCRREPGCLLPTIRISKVHVAGEK